MLVELMLVVLFFILCTSVLMQLFGEAQIQGEEGVWLTESVGEAMNLAEMLYASEDPQMALEELGFTADSEQAGRWSAQRGAYLAQVDLTEEEKEAGVLRRQEVRILRNGRLLAELPMARYWEDGQ